MRKLCSLLILLFIFTTALSSQDEKWTLCGIKVYNEIPSSCANKAEYGAVLIRRNDNYSTNKELLKKELESRHSGSISYKYYSFKYSEPAIGVFAQLNNKCDRLLKTETDWTGYYITGARDLITAKNEIEQYVNTTPEVQEYSIIQTMDLNLAVRNAAHEVVILKSMGFSGWGTNTSSEKSSKGYSENGNTQGNYNSNYPSKSSPSSTYSESIDTNKSEELKRKGILADANQNYNQAIEYYKEAKKYNPADNSLDDLIKITTQNKKTHDYLIGNSNSNNTSSLERVLDANSNTSQPEALLGKAIAEILFQPLRPASPEELRRQEEVTRRRKEKFRLETSDLMKKVANNECNSINPLLDKYTKDNSERYNFNYDSKYHQILFDYGLNDCNDKMLHAKIYSIKGQSEQTLPTKINLYLQSINSYKEGHKTKFDWANYGYGNDPMDLLSEISLKKDYELFKSKYDKNTLLVDIDDNSLTKRYEQYSNYSQAFLQKMIKQSDKKYRKKKNLPWKILGVGLVGGISLIAAASEAGTSTLINGQWVADNPTHDTMASIGGALLIGTVPMTLISIPLKKKKQRYYENQRDYAVRFLQ